MLQLYSKGCEYLIRALASIRFEDSRTGFSVRAVCKDAKIPESFTRKIFQSLVKNRIMKGRRGPGGGYCFKADPARLSLLSLIKAVDGDDAFDKCVMKDFKCDRNNYCSLHRTWMRAKNGMMSELEQSKVADLMRREGTNKGEKK